jgi:spermidine synthase
VLLGFVGSSMAAAIAGPCDEETEYHCARVVHDPARPGGRLLLLDTLRHSYVDLDDPTHLEFRYARLFADVMPEGDEPVDALHVGGGGFTFPRYVLALEPESRHTVLELDPEVLAIAQDELGLDPAGLDVRLGDARTALGRLPDDAFDLVVGDAFAGLSVPWHLTTTETLRDIDRVLRAEGRYVMNLIDGAEMRFARAETRTMLKVWPHVAVIVPSSALEGRGGSNVVLVASAVPIDAAAISGRLAARNELATQVLATPEALDAFVGDAPVLTDDFAPVDQLLVR